MKWISVDDRLPIDAATFAGVFESVCVIATDGRIVSIMAFDAGHGCGTPWASFNSYGDIAPTEITHWMPLPAPPEATP